MNLKTIFKNPSATIGMIILVSFILIAFIGPNFTQSPYKQNTIRKLEAPSGDYLFGTDEFGRDVFSRIVYGARFTLSSGLVSVFVGLIGGIILGSFSGFYGGLTDRIIMTICDILLAFPSILLAMSLVMIIGPGTYTPMIAVGISSIPIFARLVRAQFLSHKTSVFVEAARSMGASDFRMMFLHLLPNSMGPIIVQATLRIGSSILLAASLSFLGLGARPPTPEWGAMLSYARAHLYTAPYLAIIPGLAITLTVISINLIGDALRDFLDPKTRTLK